MIKNIVKVCTALFLAIIFMGSGGYSLGPISGRAVCNGTTEVTVNTPYVTATVNIFLTTQIPGGTPSGSVYVSSRVVGTSFGFKCAAADTSTIGYILIEP